jgi:acyl carrier protein
MKTTTTEDQIRESILSFILSAINIVDLDNDDHLFESGFANSLFAVQLMTFLEKRFAINIDADDLDIENFRSVNAATAFVMKKATQPS